MAGIDPVSAAITAGGGVLDGILSIIGAQFESADSKAARETSLRIAADKLGLDYPALKQSSDQYNQTMGLQLKQLAQSKGLTLQALGEQIRAAKAGEAQAATNAQTAKQEWGVENTQSQARERRMADLRNQFLSGKQNVAKGTAAPTGNLNAVAPSANKSLGAAALKTAPTPTANPVANPVATPTA